MAEGGEAPDLVVYSVDEVNRQIGGSRKANIYMPLAVNLVNEALAIEGYQFPATEEFAKRETLAALVKDALATYAITPTAKQGVMRAAKRVIAFENARRYIHERSAVLPATAEAASPLLHEEFTAGAEVVPASIEYLLLLYPLDQRDTVDDALAALHIIRDALAAGSNTADGFVIYSKSANGKSLLYKEMRSLSATGHSRKARVIEVRSPSDANSCSRRIPASIFLPTDSLPTDTQ